MESAQTQMNVRIDATRKADGDAVLGKFGMTPTYAIRTLWNYLASNKALPDFLATSRSTDSGTGETATTTFADLAEEGAGIAVRLALQSGLACDELRDVSYLDLRETAYEERFDEWEARNV